jgi:TrmH family RNA methyltransferase
MPIALGLHAPQLAAVRALRTKAGRTEQGRFAIEGATLLAEALEAGHAPEAVYATQTAYTALGAFREAISERTFFVTERTLERLSDLETPPGIVAVLPRRLESLEALLETGEPVLLLAGVGDPGNAGTLLRSAEIFGIRAAVFGALGVEPHAPKVVRAAMGALFRMSLARATPEELVTAAHRNGYSVIAASRSGTPLPQFRFPERSLIAIGNERHGVAGWLPAWDASVAIPQFGGGESLNAAVAGSIICYAHSQQRARSAK